MGADLYINSLHQGSRGTWEPQFEAASKLRDSLPKGSAARAEAETKLEYCQDQMLSQGYFRDPYNNWDLLWQFGLSWWNDIIPLLEDEARLTVPQVRRLLEMLTEREVTFDERLSALRLEDETYFRNRYLELRTFLNRAIALDEPIDCSL